jgi:hypothetical protein
MSFIYAGCISVVALSILGILAATEGIINEMRGRAISVPRVLPVSAPLVPTSSKKAGGAMRNVRRS